MKTNAFSPGLALMSSNSFSSVLYITSPSAGRSTFTVLGIYVSSFLGTGFSGLATREWLSGLAVGDWGRSGIALRCCCRRRRGRQRARVGAVGADRRAPSRRPPGPLLAVAARHELDGEASHLPGQPPVHRREHVQPE